MKIKKTRQEFFDIHNKLSILNKLTGVKLTYAIMRIKNTLAAEIKAVNEMAKEEPGFTEYNQKRIEMVEKFCKRDEKDAPIIVDNNYTFEEGKKEEFEKELETLKASYQDDLDERDEQFKNIDKYVAEEVEISFWDVKSKYLPENITLEQMEVIAPFVTDFE